MRMDKRKKITEKKLERCLIRKKRIAVFVLVFSFYLGLTIVDSACSEMTRSPGALTLQLMRIDEDHLSMSFLSREVTINTSLILSEVSRMKDSASEAVSVLTRMAAGRDDDRQSQSNYNTPDRELPFPSKIL